MIKHPLIRHPGTPCAAITSIQIEARRPGPGLLALRYRLLGDIARLWLPDHAVVAERQDFLWKRTCMEVFIQTPGRQSYTEF